MIAKIYIDKRGIAKCQVFDGLDFECIYGHKNPQDVIEFLRNNFPEITVSVGPSWSKKFGIGTGDRKANELSDVQSLQEKTDD